MRISDWSSDVCSSDLHRATEGAGEAGEAAEIRRQQGLETSADLARQDRRLGTTGDADDQRIAVDDRGGDEAGEIRPVDEVHRHAGALCRSGDHRLDIGRASWRERVGQYVEIRGVAGY